ncbi:MAG: serine/threonine-protein kinase [Cyanobacteria bacterium P01_F01_bin.150]
MSYCLNIACAQPANDLTDQFCRTCGDRLRLKERYRSLKVLGKGGFGRTFLAVDEDIPSKPKCVIKQLYFQNTDDDYRKKAIALFQQEAVRLDELGQHPQIPQLLAHFTQNDNLYLVQEFVNGPTLRQYQQQKGCLTEQQIWQLLNDLLPVLQFIHQRRVIHRDIKPDNIIYSRKINKPVLIDFGVAKVATETNWMRTGTVIGSPEFMAPEQARGKTVPATDLYSLGVTCLALMTTVCPLDMYDIADDRWVWRDFLKDGQGVSDRLGTILDTLLKTALNQRYPSAQSVIEAITNTNNQPTIIPNSPTPQLPNSPTPKLPPPNSFPPAPSLAFPNPLAHTPDPPPDAPLIPPAPPFPNNLGQTILPNAPASSPTAPTAPEQPPAPKSAPAAPAPLPPLTPLPPPSPAATSSQSKPLFKRLINHFKPQEPKGKIVVDGLDYTPLQYLLSSGKWLEADQLTHELMGLAIGKTRHHYFKRQDILDLPCADIAMLNRLWHTHSKGRFGFMIQLQLFQAVEADYAAFCHQVRWPVHRTTAKNYLTPSLSAVPGHLPSRRWAAGSSWWSHMEWLLERWTSCS